LALSLTPALFLEGKGEKPAPCSSLSLWGEERVRGQAEHKQEQR